MTDNFKYVRLEISSVLLRSWSDLLTSLRRKHHNIQEQYVALLYCGKNQSRKSGKLEIPSCVGKYKCSYFIYNENNVWIFFNRYNSSSDRYQDSINKKIKFISKLRKINEKFNEDVNDKSLLYSLRDEEFKKPFKRYAILQIAIPMITLNAAIVEGALREILARYIQNEINKYVEEGNRTGRYEHNNYQKILVAKQIKIESNSSYSSILDEYSVIFDIKLKDLISKEILIILDSLFTLRNLFAHGTSIVTTNTPVEHDLYFKNWNTRVVKMQTVLKKYFGSDSIHENISDYRLAEFYMSYSKIYLMKIAEYVKNYDESGCKAVESVNTLKFLEKDELNCSSRYNKEYLDLYDFPKS